MLAVVGAFRLVWGTLLWWVGCSVRFTLHIVLLGGGGGLVGVGLSLPMTALTAFGVYLVVIGHTWEAVKQTSELASDPVENSSG